MMDASLPPAFKFEKTDTGIVFEFPSEMVNVDAVCEAVTRFLKSQVQEISPHLFAINLGLREGLTNAIRHGNKSVREKKVKLSLDLIAGGSRLKMTIQDEGEGFDWRENMGKIPPDEADHGRGFLIMETYFSRVYYNPKGNILCLEKQL